jgi:ribosomal-protein-alanine N-acetyltransferase
VSSTVQDAPVRIGPMRRRHLRSVVRIERLVYPEPWSIGLYVSELALGSARVYRVAKDGTKVVGYGGLLFTPDEAHVTTLAVDPERQGRRIGTRLLLALARSALAYDVAGLTLEVRAGNEAAQALYRRFGFAPAGIRKNYYRKVGEDAIVMWVHDIDGDAYGRRLAEIEAALPSPTDLEGSW